MNELPRQKLCEIIVRYGRSLCEDPQRCEGLLRDLCGQYRKELSALVSALKEGIPAELVSSQNNVPIVVLLARLAKRLQENCALDETAAKWAVESWALALGVISNSNFINSPVSQSPQPVTPITSIYPTTPIASAKPANISSQPAPLPIPLPTSHSHSSRWLIIALVSALGILALVGGVLHSQEQQRLAIQQEISELKAKEKQRLEAEQHQREQTELDNKETESRLAEEQRKRQEVERRLEAERQRQEAKIPKTIDSGESINEGQAISLLEDLYTLLSEKNFSRAITLYSSQLSESFSPSFFNRFERVTVEDLQITSRTNNSINFIGQNTYVWPDGSTQREARSYTVRLISGELKITSSEFIKITKSQY